MRLWVGIVLLAALLLGSLGVYWEMQAIHTPIGRDLTYAAALAESGDTVRAKELSDRAKSRWQQNWQFTASFADHTPMEEIDALFGGLGAYPPDSEDFIVRCLELRERTKAMANAHVPSWWNLL